MLTTDLEEAKKHFDNALQAAGSSLAGVAKLGQVRRFRAASRTSLGDVVLRQGKFKDASKFYNDAIKGAQEDKRLDLIWPAQRGLGRSLWLQAAQEKDAKKALTLRESALTNYRRVAYARSKRCEREVCVLMNRAPLSSRLSKTYSTKPRQLTQRWR